MRPVLTSHVWNFQDVWSVSQAYNYMWSKSWLCPWLRIYIIMLDDLIQLLITYRWVIPPPPATPLYMQLFLNVECPYTDLLVWFLHFIISPRLYLKWNSCICKEFTLTNTNTIFISSASYWLKTINWVLFEHLLFMIRSGKIFLACAVCSPSLPDADVGENRLHDQLKDCVWGKERTVLCQSASRFTQCYLSKDVVIYTVRSPHFIPSACFILIPESAFYT